MILASWKFGVATFKSYIKGKNSRIKSRKVRSIFQATFLPGFRQISWETRKTYSLNPEQKQSRRIAATSSKIRDIYLNFEGLRWVRPSASSCTPNRTGMSSPCRASLASHWDWWRRRRKRWFWKLRTWTLAKYLILGNDEHHSKTSNFHEYIIEIHNCRLKGP